MKDELMNYEEMLEKGIESLPKKGKDSERFEIPELESVVQGKRTIIKNAIPIFKLIRRDVSHFIKYLIKEYGVPVSLEGKFIVINRKLSKRQIKSTFEEYLKEYVICPICGKPDTIIVDLHGVKVLQCEACGAISPVKRL